MVGNSTYIYIYLYTVLYNGRLELRMPRSYPCIRMYIYIYICVHIMKAPASPNIGKNG